MAESTYRHIVDVIVPIWSELLDVEDTTVTETTDFFRAGGTSLTAMLAVARVEQELGKAAPLSALVKNPTVSSFAGYLFDSADGALVDQARGRDASESQLDYLLRYNEADRQEKRNARFEKYYARAMRSAAHAEFCQRVYGKNFGQHGMADFSQIEVMLHRLNPTSGDVLLDVGCGYGLISKYISEQTGARVVGIDLSPSAIEYAKTLAEENDNLQFHLMDLRHLEFPRETFSHIISIDTIYYAPSLKSTLQTFKEIGTSPLRMAVVRTFPMRSFTRETWNPHLTELGSALEEAFGRYEVVDFSKDENEHWSKKLEVLQSLREEFVEEGSEELFQFRYDEAKYETGIEQLRYMFLVGA
jgi:2-polyprenyl-3-methyl-5-hydroxy-6-metoxy-1,4-benzoquinol methylase